MIIAERIVAGRTPGRLITFGAGLFKEREESFFKQEVERICRDVYYEIKRRGGIAPPPEQLEKMLEDKLRIFFM